MSKSKMLTSIFHFSQSQALQRFMDSSSSVLGRDFPYFFVGVRFYFYPFPSRQIMRTNRTLIFVLPAKIIEPNENEIAGKRNIWCMIELRSAIRIAVFLPLQSFTVLSIYEYIPLIS